MRNGEDDQPGAPSARKSVVACLGSSSTAGKGQAFDWIGALRIRRGNEKYLFLNFGVGGDLAYNALQRLPDVIACRPDMVVVLVGGNDALALVSMKAKRFFRVAKHLPCEPSPGWFRTNLQAIARRLKAETSATIALCSLTPIGEDPEPTNLFQREINQRIEEYSAIIRDIAREDKVGYIGVYESMQARVQASPGKALTSFKFLPLYRDAFRALLLHRSPDEIAQMNGWLLHTDGVHLNSRGGMIIADHVQTFIAQTTSRPSSCASERE
jgi:lysophospholipase L1-like esterase